MNYWRYIVLSLLGFIMVFHLGAVWIVRDRQYELTSADYYAEELNHEFYLQKLRNGSQYRWDVTLDRATWSLSLRLRDQQDAPLVLTESKANLYRPHRQADDRQIILNPREDRSMVGDVRPMGDGRWDLTIEGFVGNRPVAFRQRLSLP